MNFYFKFLLKFILHCPQMKLHNKTPTLGKTAQRNHNTGQNCTTKSQHWTKLHNEITTLGKTAQRNHNTGQNCTTKSQHWTKLHNQITTLYKTAHRNHNTGQNCTTKAQHWTKLYNQITTLGKTAQRNHSEVQVLRSSRPEAFCKKCVLRDFAKFKGKRLCQILFFNKVVGLRSAQMFSLAQMFSCEFCEIFKNNFFNRTHPVVASWCCTKKFIENSFFFVLVLLNRQKIKFTSSVEYSSC